MPRSRCAARMACTSRHVGAIERHVERVDEVLAQVGDEAAERIGEARPRRHQHLGDAELARQRHRVQRPGAAEGEQREVARVVAARQRHHADGAGHVRVGEPDDGRRRRVDVEAERRGRACRRRSSRTCVDRHRPRHGQQPLRVEPAEHQVGVGDGRLGAAAAVADRARARSPRDCGPTCSMPAASIEAIEPPPAPTRAARRPSARGSAGRSRW